VYRYNKAKHDAAEAKRSVRESGKEKAVIAGVEASQRSVIRELTQRAAALGRDKAELVDERDKLRERLRSLKASMGGRVGGNFDTIDRRPTPNHGGDTPTSSPGTPRASVSVTMVWDLDWDWIGWERRYDVNQPTPKLLRYQRMLLSILVTKRYSRPSS
jgi:hypothetical protein